MDSRRAEAFSDGVFAVAITVLVFNLLPLARKDVTGEELAKAWPQYGAYVVSFLTIGIMWLNHHTVLAQVRKVDRVTLVLNLLLLLTVVAVPFPTALVAANLGPGSKQSGAQLAAVMYGISMIAMSAAFSALWMYISSHAASLGGSMERPPLQRTLRFSGGGLGYVVAVFVAFKSPLASVAIYGALAVYYLFEHLPGPNSDENAAAADGGSVQEPG